MDAENMAGTVDAVVPEWDRRCPHGLSTEGMRQRQKRAAYVEKSMANVGPPMIVAGRGRRWRWEVEITGAHGPRVPLTSTSDAFCELGVG